MITKGIIKTIDYSNNSCKVRIPLFETANTSDEVILPAIFLTQPGVYNGYNEGDIVFVGFEGSGLDCPIVLGKLFLGASKESENSKKGSIEASNLVVDSTATLPLTTKLTFKDTSKTQVQVANRYSNYKSLLDIIDAINNTEENITVANKNFMNSTSSVVSKVVTEYLSQAENLSTPTKENPGWSTSMPDLTDGFDIWQKTTCYNHRGEILGEPEILCLTGVVASFIYTIATSSKVHTGTAQTEKIVVEAKVKIGTQSETADNNALIRYSWSDSVWIEAQEPQNKIEITECRDKDLIIKAYHQTGIDADNEPIYTEYATETITFIAQNTPTLDLSSDSASIAYDSFGDDKINPNDEVSTTATLYFNGQVVEDAEYTWNWAENKCDAIASGNTITVSNLKPGVEIVDLTCITEYNNVTLSKAFVVTKTLQGNSPYKIDIVNEFVSIITESDGIIPEDYSWDTNTLHTVNIYYGDKLEERTISVGTATPTSDSGLYLKYTVTVLTAEELTSISASFTNKASALGANVDRGEIKYELYEGTVLVASEKFELVRIKCGEAAMHYTGRTSTNTIKRDPAGNLTPETITVWLDKTVGHDINTVNTTDYQLYYSKTKEDSLALLQVSESAGISINNNKWTIDTNKLGIQGQLSLDFRVTLGDSSDFTTISMMDIPVVNDGESVDVEYAYWWSDNYYDSNNKMWDLEAPTSVLTQETAAAETWFKPSTIPTINSYNNCKIIFVSRRMGIASDINSALWSKPEMFAVANSEAYKILSTAEGLFGYGQGLYYTFQVPESPTASQQELFTTTADGKKQIAISKIPSSAGSYNCIEGAKITATQEEIAYWISEDPTVRKELIKVYIDAEYIKTGALTVGDPNNPLFQAGLDDETVKIAGFNVSENGIYSDDFYINYETAGTSTSGVYVGTDGIRLGKNFSVDPDGEVIARSLKVGNTDSTETADLGVQITTGGKIKATNLEVESAQITDLVTDQLAVLTTDSEGNRQPILLVNATADEDGEITRTEGNVQIGGFSVHSSNFNNITDDGYISIGTNGIVLGKSEASEEPPFMVKSDGELTATRGTFNGSITASGSALQNNKSFSMSMEEGSEATFDKISARGSISTTSDINSLGGYFFGTDNSCGFKLAGASTTDQEVELKISTIAPTLAEITNSRYCYYAITIYLVKKGTTTRVNAANDIQITYTSATWSNALTTVTIPGKTITLKAGSSSYTDGKTVANMSNFSDLKFELMHTYDTYGSGTRAVVDGSGLGGLKMPIGTPSPKPYIDTPSNLTFTQKVISNANNIELNCNTFKMNGSISMTGNVTSSGAFYVKNSSNETLVTLDSNGLTTEKAVKFKVGSKYYEPAIRLGTDGSPNCFWSKAFEIGGDGGSGWKSVTLPSDLQDNSGSSGNNSKIIAILATGKFPKDVNNKDPDSGDAQGATFYTWWDGTTAYVYNPVSKAPSTFIINIVVLGKI